MGQFTMRILDRQYVANTDITNALATVADATAANLPGATLAVQDLSGNMVTFRYVQLAASGLATITAVTPVYFTDQTCGVVTNTPANAFTHVASTDSAVESAAGFLLNANMTAGQYGFIQTGGYNPNITSPASVVKGDRLVLSNAAGTAPTANLLVRVAGGTAPATPEAMAQMYVVATGSVASGVAAGIIKGFCAQV